MKEVLDLLGSPPNTPPLLQDEEFFLPPAHTRRTGMVMQLRTSHHLLARALAEGKPTIAAARIAGYSPDTVSKLRQDPGFQELLEYYKAQIEDIFESLQDRMAALGVSFLDELQHRLETEPETFSNDQLRKLAETMLDRTIAPAKTAGRGGGSAAGSGVSVTVSFTDVGASAPRVIEGEVIR